MILLTSAILVAHTDRRVCCAGRWRAGESSRWKVIAHLEHHSADALGDFRRAERARIVGPDHQHDGLRLESLAFAILRPQSTPCVVSPATAKLAVLMAPKYLSNIALLASPCTHQSVIESP